MPLPQIPPTFTAVTTGSNEYSIELNDANLETQAWKKPRYEGCQTTTQQLNKFTEGDVTYGKTTAVQKYSRNIYIGNSVIGMTYDSNEDSSLVNFPNFSYVTTKRFITVNDDNTVTNTNLGNQKLTFDEKRGFYRAFYADFPERSNCQIILNDENIRSSLKTDYNIYFNGGLLQKLMHIQSSPTEELGAVTFLKDRYIGVNTHNSPSAQELLALITNPNDPNIFSQKQGGLYFLGEGTTIEEATSAHTASLFNEEIYSDWFTGSLQQTITVNALFTDKGETIGYQYEAQQFSFGGLHSFCKDFFNYQGNSSYKGDKRLFATFTEQHTIDELESGFNKQPIYTTRTGSYITNGIITNTLTELSTVEMNSLETGSSTAFELELITSAKSNLSFDYATNNVLSGAFGTTQQPASFDTGSVILSKTEDSTPSLLLKLVKDKELPDGTGRKSFIILPENIHPHIKNNLTHFLSKAGISLDLDTIPALDNTYEKLK